jgi:predicted ferric reductase
MNESAVSWAWYIERSAGLVSFLLLYLVMFLGIAIRFPVIRKIIQPCYSFNIHCWLSLQALVFALIHGLALLFDKMYKFSWLDIFMPFHLQMSFINTNFLALGIIGFYLMLILVITSYGIRFIGRIAWRIFHFLNIILYIFVVIHAYFLGTDLKIPVIREIFIWMNALLVILLISNLFFRLIDAKYKESHEDLCKSDSTR